MENNIIGVNKKLDELSNNEIIDILWNALNKATLKGVYNMDEVFMIKVLFDKLKNNVS